MTGNPNPEPRGPDFVTRPGFCHAAAALRSHSIPGSRPVGRV